MKKIRLTNEKVENFKGIASGNFAFNGENTEIVADVMQGKTSVKQAFLWALGRAKRLPFAPAVRSTAPMEAAWPMQ